jgi:uncharacterized protein
MIRHLTGADYRPMPWANGRGVTLELLREDGPDGLALRLSVARVTGDGPFSALPGIDRSLTVISGPGFDLTGPGLALRADPLCPVGFSGDSEVSASGVRAPSEDFNVMTDRRLHPRPEVSVTAQPGLVAARGARLLVLALGPVSVNGGTVGARDLLDARCDLRLDGAGPVIVVRLNV